MPQQSMTEFLDAMSAAGLLQRLSGPHRVDELPRIMENYPKSAILVDNVKDCEFSFLANAYATQEQYAWALGCDISQIGFEMARRSKGRIPPVIVDDAPCKEVIRRGAEVDLTILPLFLHHDRDGCAYINDTRVISADPETGIRDWGIYRLMFRRLNETGIDLTIASHRCRKNAEKARELGQNLPIAVCIGGPPIDKIASLTSAGDDVDDFDVLGSFYGEPARLVRCETNDLMVPANAEIVLEGEIISSEGWVHDEGPYGEFTGMYGGGLKLNNRIVFHCMTYRKGAIYQHATVGGSHPWYTDDMLQLPAIETDIYRALEAAGIDVKGVRADEGGLSNIAYAQIRPRSGGDAKTALNVMLTCSPQAYPKIAMVFDEDVDIWDSNAVHAAMGFRYMPHKDTVLLHQLNAVPLDPKIPGDAPPVYGSKIGLDCTIPVVLNGLDRHAFDKSTAADLGDPPELVTEMSITELESAMRSFLKQEPRTWKEIVTAFHGQRYTSIYRAFSNMRPELTRSNEAPYYPYLLMPQADGNSEESHEAS